MLTKKKGLGRNLEALLGPCSILAETADSPEKEQVLWLSVNDLRPGAFQPRKAFDSEALKELSDSIRQHGVLQPILVRSTKKKGYEIVAGERRFRAAKIAELSTIPCIIKRMSDAQVMAVALIENLQREDLNVIDQALAIQRLLEEFSMTHQQIAQSLGQSRATISNLLRLLNLEQDVQALLENGELEMGHGRSLLALPKAEQLKMALLVIEHGFSVRETEARIRVMLNPTVYSQTANPVVEQSFVDFQERLQKHLGVSVQINQSKTGKGKLTIAYKNKETLEKILSYFESVE